MDPKIFASGSETIGFELCKTKGKGADNETCAGGEEEPNVGVTITYSYGPDAQQKNTTTGEYYYGLYKIDFYPFNSGEFTPQVTLPSTGAIGQVAMLTLLWGPVTGEAQQHVRELLLRFHRCHRLPRLAAPVYDPLPRAQRGSSCLTPAMCSISCLMSNGPQREAGERGDMRRGLTCVVD